MNIFKKKEKTVKQVIIDTFYSDYPNIPYISDDRSEEWIEQAKLLPKQSIIPKSMMKRYRNGLLPGHIYMMYWLGKYTNKKVPVYFEYKYGIDFEKEKVFLHQKGFLDNSDKPTDKGEKEIEKHYDVIENHKAKKPSRSFKDIEKQMLEQIKDMRKNGDEEYIFIANSDCCESCRALHDKHFPISKFQPGVNAPPMHDGCRCAIAPYFDRKEYDEWLDFISNGGTSKQRKKHKKKSKHW